MDGQLGSDDLKKELYRNAIRNVTEFIGSLPEDSLIRKILAERRQGKPSILDQEAKDIEKLSGDNLDLKCVHPLFLFVEAHAREHVLAFEDNINLILKVSEEKVRAEILDFLRSGPTEDRKWDSRIFEISLKAKLKRTRETVELDCPLANGRNVDIRMELGGRKVNLECSVLSDSDEDRKVWNGYIEAKEQNSNALPPSRPSGPYEPKNPLGPSSYYDSVRFYEKVYDKLTLGLDPSKGQISLDSPNILLISIRGVRSPLHPKSPGIRRALDELFSVQPRPGYRGDSSGERIDGTLLGWLLFKIKGRGIPDPMEADALFQELLTLPRRISGIFLFDEMTFRGVSRLNYNADPGLELSHQDLVRLEGWFRTPPTWEL
jgi:hypothetical protein